MKKVLLTAFEPLAGERINPSWQAVSQLHHRLIGDASVVAKQLPCAFGTSLEVLYATIEAVKRIW